MKKLLLILMLFPVVGWGQLYYTKPTTSGTSSTPYVYDGGWSVPVEWADSLGAIDITDGRNLAASTIKILVDTRAGNRTFAFTVTAANGYTVKWGKKETGISYANNALAERTYDTTKCQRFAVIEITKTGAGAITAFTVSPSSTYPAVQNQYPVYLWIAANYTGACPVMFLAAQTVWCVSLQAIWLSSITSIAIESLSRMYGLKSITVPSSCTSAEGFWNNYAINKITFPSSVTTIGSFLGNQSLNSLTFTGNVTTIPSGFAQDCRSLRSVVIPSTVTSIGAYAFAGCMTLKYVTYNGTVTTSADNQDIFQFCAEIDTLNFKGLKTTRFKMYGYSGRLNKLGASGNLANDSIPIRIDWANSTFSGSAPQLNLSYNSMTAAQLTAICRLLPTVVGKTVDFTGNPGAATFNHTSADAKGWTVTH